MIDLADFAKRLKMRFQTDMLLLEDAAEELVALAQYLEDGVPDEEYASRCVALVNMTAHITGADLWDKLQEIYDHETCVLDLVEVEVSGIDTDKDSGRKPE